MKTLKTNWMSALVLGALATSCGSVQDVKDRSATTAGHTHDATLSDDDEDGDDENEVAVALDQVPEAVRKAALAAVPGFVLVSAEKETEEGELRYCLEGTADGESVEIEVNAGDSKVVEIERGEDDD